MEIKINIDEKELEIYIQAEMIVTFIARGAINKSSFRYDLKDAIGEGVKAHIYSSKEEIIERVVERASKEIVRKGLPRLLEEAYK